MTLKFLPQHATRCPSTREVKRQTEASYKAQHAKLLAELSAVVGKPLPAVESMARI